MQNVQFRFLALTLLFVGFVGGALAVLGCGGGGGVAFAANGSRTVIHTKSLAAPEQWMDEYTFTATFTPSNPDTVVLGIEVIGVLETGDTPVQVRLRTRRAGSPGLLGTSILASPNATAPLSMHAPFEFSSGVLPTGTYTFDVLMFPDAAGVTATVTSLTLRIITSEGVTLMDPSPEVS